MAQRDAEVLGRRCASRVQDHCRHNRWQKALHVLAEMRQFRLQPDSATQGLAIGSCARGQQWVRALAMFEDMRQESLQPDANAYSAVVAICEKRERWAQALDLLAEARNDRQLQLPPVPCGATVLSGGSSSSRNTQSADPMLAQSVVEAYGATIRACVKNERWSHAICVLTDMIQSGVRPDEPTCSAVMSSPCGHVLEWSDALAILGEMQELGALERVAPGTHDAAILACDRGAQWAHVLDLFSQMTHHAFPPNFDSYRAVLRACEKRRQWTQALEVLSELRQQRCQVDVYMYNDAIGACEAAMEWAQSLSLLSDLRQSVKPDEITYKAAFSACEMGEQWAHALELLGELQYCSLQPDVSMYNSVIGACGMEWRKSMEVLVSMRRSQQPLNVGTYVAAITSCAKGNEVKGALGLLKVMQHTGLRPTPSAYSAVIEACVRCQQWSCAMELLEEMQAYRSEFYVGSLVAESSVDEDHVAEHLEFIEGRLAAALLVAEDSARGPSDGYTNGSSTTGQYADV